MNTLITANKLVAQYGLLPHPEGGYYKENYRSSERISVTARPDRFKEDKCLSTAIYFLLENVVTLIFCELFRHFLCYKNIFNT
jgi:predicted cupin superfamily sugar epimerase